MKKLTRMIPAVLACFLLLTACAGEASPAAWTAADTQAILDSGAFSEELEELDCDTAWMLYRLSEVAEREQLTGGTVYRSAGATCEELALLVFENEAAADAALEAVEDYVQAQIDANRDYRPAEIPKLEGKWLEQRGNTLLLVVAGDMDAARAAVE